MSIFLLLACAHAESPLATVPALDLERYAGTWYEISRFENRFEKGCEGVTATYGLRDDGKVDVTNVCRKGSPDGEEKSSTGIARRPDPAVPGVLEVSFFRPFWGDYQVIALDPEYGWSVVGTPDREYLWVLSRTPSLPDDVYAGALAAAEAQGFPTDQLRPTRQR